MEENKLKFGFFGTPDVAAETLQVLLDFGYVPSLIVTAPDAPAGRGLKIEESAVAVTAKETSVPCLKPKKLDKEFVDQIKSEDFDLFVVVAYGQIIPEEILKLPKLGSINVHYSLLPKYRGASPVESAILNGETETGVSIQKMVYKLDAGPVIAQAKTYILPDETAPALRLRLIALGGEFLKKVMGDFRENKIGETPQNDSAATYAPKIEKEDGLLDLNDDPIKNYNKFRAYAAWPRTYFFKDGKRIIVTAAELKDGKFVIKRVIPEGKKEQDYKG